MSQNRPKMVGTVVNLEKLELKRLKSRVERLVSALEEALETETGDSYDSFSPSVDLKENKDMVTVFAELPGVSADEIELSISAKNVVIEGEKRHSTNTIKATSHFCCERGYGRFHRAIVLRWAININEAKAELRDGLLTVRLPKLVERRGKSVRIEVVSDEPSHETS